jgi:hypothetical protein
VLRVLQLKWHTTPRTEGFETHERAWAQEDQVAHTSDMSTQPPPEQRSERKNARPTAAPGSNWCSACQVFHPTSEFAWRNKAKGTLSSKCKKSQREYAKSHYGKNKETITAKIRQRSSTLRSAGRAHLTAAAEKGSCWMCATPGTATKLRANTAEGVPVPSKLINNDAPIAEIEKVLQHPETVWICAHCWGRTEGVTEGTPRQGYAVTVRGAVLQMIGAQSRSLADIYAGVEALGAPTTVGSLGVLLSKMVKRGEIVRVSRGRYAAA